MLEESYIEEMGWKLKEIADFEYVWDYRPGEFVQEDGRIGPNEDFSNNLESFMFDPELLKKKTPKAYGQIKPGKSLRSDLELKFGRASETRAAGGAVILDFFDDQKFYRLSAYIDKKSELVQKLIWLPVGELNLAEVERMLPDAKLELAPKPPQHPHMLSSEAYIDKRQGITIKTNADRVEMVGFAQSGILETGRRPAEKTK